MQLGVQALILLDNGYICSEAVVYYRERINDVSHIALFGNIQIPPTDPVNALLSLAYSLLAKDCLLAALAIGFDPYVGFYHQPRFGRPALALDLMEEFRPLVAESSVLSCINNRRMRPLLPRSIERGSVETPHQEGSTGGPR